MSILVSEKNRAEIKRTFVVSALCSLFCIVFSFVYYMFSHGVHSPFMTFLFAWPLILCALPAGLFLLIRKIPGPSVLSSLFWHTGTAAVTVSSMLRGIFDIAGNSSIYQAALMITGIFFLACGAFLYVTGVVMITVE